MKKVACFLFSVCFIVSMLCLPPPVPASTLNAIPQKTAVISQPASQLRELPLQCATMECYNSPPGVTVTTTSPSLQTGTVVMISANSPIVPAPCIYSGGQLSNNGGKNNFDASNEKNQVATRQTQGRQCYYAIIRQVSPAEVEMQV